MKSASTMKIIWATSSANHPPTEIQTQHSTNNLTSSGKAKKLVKHRRCLQRLLLSKTFWPAVQLLFSSQSIWPLPSSAWMTSCHDSHQHSSALPRGCVDKYIMKFDHHFGQTNLTRICSMSYCCRSNSKIQSHTTQSYVLSSHTWPSICKNKKLRVVSPSFTICPVLRVVQVPQLSLSQLTDRQRCSRKLSLFSGMIWILNCLCVLERE